MDFANNLVREFFTLGQPFGPTAFSKLCFQNFQAWLGLQTYFKRLLTWSKISSFLFLCDHLFLQQIDKIRLNSFKQLGGNPIAHLLPKIVKWVSMGMWANMDFWVFSVSRGINFCSIKCQKYIENDTFHWRGNPINRRIRIPVNAHLLPKTS